MSVEITSKGGSVGESISNGTFAAIVALARAFGENVPEWNGCHDGQEFTPAHCAAMAGRLRQLANPVYAEILEDCLKDGGFTIS